jgi:hypothetical protein
MNNPNDIDTKELMDSRRPHETSYQPRKLPDAFKQAGHITLFIFYSWCILICYVFLIRSGNVNSLILAVTTFWLPLAMLLSIACRRKCLFDLLPTATRQDYLQGRLFLPIYGKEFTAPQKFFIDNSLIELRADGLALPRHYLPWLEKYIYSSKKPYPLEANMWIIPWSHITVAAVSHVSDEIGDLWTYDIQLISRQNALIHTRSRVEPRLLDAFRAIGRKPVRIKHEIE